MNKKGNFLVLLLMLGMLFGLPISMFAQKHVVTGTVVDQNGEPMVAVTVMEKGTSNGTITNFDGVFSLSVANNATLSVSFVGFKTQETSTTGKSNVRIVLREDNEQLDEIVVFDLNRVDSLTLMQIPGIGSGIAGMILNYRRQLGGFYDVSQLAEIRLDYQLLLPWFEVHEEDITRIPVNRSSVERLRNHPYMNFYQARAFVEYRQRHGDIKNLRTFILYDEFTEQDLERLSHYLSFE